VIFFRWRMRGGMFQSGTVSWIKIQDGGYNKKRPPWEWSEERCEMQAIVTSDRQPACQLHLSAARQIHSRRNSFQRWNDVREIRTVNSVRKTGGTCFYAILSSWVLGYPRRHKHQQDDTRILPLNEDDNWHRCLSAMEDKTLLKPLVFWFLISNQFLVF